MNASDLLKRQEGFSRIPYNDSRGILTIGYGLNLQEGIDEQEADWLLRHRMAKAEAVLRAREPYFTALNEVRQAVLVNMAYNLGWNGFMAFVKMRAAIAAGDFAMAKKHGLDSRWRAQVGDRAVTLMDMLESGEWPK